VPCWVGVTNVSSLAHRLRDIQLLPYTVVKNHHMSHVYELYYRAFEKFRKVPYINSIEENDRFCDLIKGTLTEHLTVIPRLVMGVIEVQDRANPDAIDKFVITMLRSVSLNTQAGKVPIANVFQRISRRVIAEQHIALTESHHEQRHKPSSKSQFDPDEVDHVGEIFLRCNAKSVIETCGSVIRELMQRTYGRGRQLPEIKIEGHLDATFPYILSHLEYIISELLRNSIQATMEHGEGKYDIPPPIEVLICETAQHVIMRFSDRGGGISLDILPHIWSFSKGPRRNMRLENLNRVPKLAATMQELQTANERDSSLSSLSGRLPELRLGIGLPMSKIYAEYWAGSLQLHSLEGYGVDAYLQISKLGNKNEHIATRASMDAV
jgi:pyruvate dehydrogenase kinase 2/3/4